MCVIYMCAIQVYIILIYNIYYTSIYKIHIYMNIYISTYIYTSEFRSLDGMSFPSAEVQGDSGYCGFEEESEREG